jgi:hypothetical protein
VKECYESDMQSIIMSTNTFHKVRLCLGIGLLTLTALATPAWAGAPEQSLSWVDRDHFPEAYSILTSDRVMFPDDVSDWPLKIDSTHQLFIDDYLMSEIDGLTRQFHQPVKHPKPLMPGGYVGVLYDQAKGQFRIWNDERYFTSTDGIQWEKPNLGPDGNVLIKNAGNLRGFMYNPDLPEAEGRYKTVFERYGSNEEEEPGGFYLYHSRDGLKWEQHPKRPILQRTMNCMLPCEFRPAGVGDPAKFQNSNPDHFQSYGVGDTSTFRYDTVLKRYICDGKFNLIMPGEKIKQLGINTERKPRLKLRTFSESEDLIHWSPPRFMMYPDRLDALDCQIYAHVGFVYESMWVGIIQRMKYQETGWKRTDLALSYSRDGRHWLRPQDRQPFIPLGDADSWEADYSVSSFTAPVQMGDELYIYYSSTRNSERNSEKPNAPWPPKQIGLAKLRRDGFASLNAGVKPGRIVTRPLTFHGKSLFVSADVADGGWIRAAVLTRDSQPIPGYDLENAVPLTNNTTKGQMTWNSKKKLAPPGEDHLRLVFQLKHAKLYSFWLD